MRQVPLLDPMLRITRVLSIEWHNNGSNNTTSLLGFADFNLFVLLNVFESNGRSYSRRFGSKRGKTEAFPGEDSFL